MPRINTSPRRRHYARDLAHYTRRHRQILILGGLFVAGTVLGTLLLRSAGEETLTLLERLLGGLMERRQLGLYDGFLSALSSSLLYVGLLFLLGFCAVGQPVIVAAPLVRGLGFGISAASLFARYGASATGFVGVLLLPGMLVSTVALLLCCRLALGLSCGLFAALRPGGKPAAEGSLLKGYLVGFGAAVLICGAGAFLEGVLCYLFANSFVLR